MAGGGIFKGMQGAGGQPPAGMPGGYNMGIGGSSSWGGNYPQQTGSAYGPPPSMGEGGGNRLRPPINFNPLPGVDPGYNLPRRPGSGYPMPKPGGGGNTIWPGWGGNRPVPAVMPPGWKEGMPIGWQPPVQNPGMPPAGGYPFVPGGGGSGLRLPGFITGGPDDPSKGGSGYWTGGSGYPVGGGVGPGYNRPGPGVGGGGWWSPFEGKAYAAKQNSGNG